MMLRNFCFVILFLVWSFAMTEDTKAHEDGGAQPNGAEKSAEKSADEKTYTETEAHKYFAVTLFNHTWDFIDKKERTREEEFEMIHAAHASRFHWGHVGEPVNFARGEWQVSRVYAILGRGEPALYHGLECLRGCEAAGIGDFDIAFAHECVARAYAALGDREGFERHYAKAREFGEVIADQADRDYFFQDLDGGNWFGMR